MHLVLIRQFVHEVPISSLGTSMQSIVSLIGSASDAKVIVSDSHGKPLGVVVFQDVLLGLAASTSLSSQTQPATQGSLAVACSILSAPSQPSIDGEPISHQSLQYCLDWITRLTGRSPLRPTESISADSSLSDFREKFRAYTAKRQTILAPVLPSSVPSPRVAEPLVEWVVIDEQGLGLGLLDQQAVWRTLALSADLDPVDTAVTSGTSLSPSLTDAEGYPPLEPNTLGQAFIKRLAEAQTHSRQLAIECFQWQNQAHRKDDILAYVSHELKTPLTAIAGLSDLLIHGTASSTERQRYYAQLIQQSSHQLLILMTGLLDLVHIETGQLPLSMQSVALYPLCEAAHQQACEERSLTLTVEDRPSNLPSDHQVTHQEHPSTISTEREVMNRSVDNPVQGQEQVLDSDALNIEIQPGINHIVADEHRLKRLLVSLLLNALQLRDADTNIRIRVEADNHWTLLHVQHTGESISVEQQQHIFRHVDLFEPGTSAHLQGIGLRFMLALRLAELHGGTLTFLAHNTGMEITVFLPRRPADQASPVPNTDDASVVSLMTQTMTQEGPYVQTPLVVVAETDPARILQLHNVLSVLGYWVAIARSGAEAMDKVHCLHPTLIVLNPALPYLPDVELMTELKQAPQTKSIPLVASVAPPSTSSRHLIDGYLTFPLNPATVHYLFNTLTQEANQSRPLHPTDLDTITLLYFNPLQFAHAEASIQLIGSDEWRQTEGEAEPLALSTILHPYHCRVIEVDSLDQAELLTRVWHPDLIIFDSGQSPTNAPYGANPSHYLTELIQHDELAKLPIVTLRAEATEVAHRLGLQVFPCLEPLVTVRSDDERAAPSLALVQVIRLAASSRMDHAT